jgi:RHS repeat-associated protein
LGGRGATGGYPYQFFYYSAFGESLVQQHANTGHFATPYKFNAKELDMETGNYYYGARYYNPQTSIWFGVEPLAGDNGNYGGDITYSNSYFTHITDSDIPSFLDAINQAMVIEELVHAGQYEFIVTTMGNSSEHKIPTLDNEFEAKVITGIILQQMGYSFKDLSDLDLPTQYGFQISSGKATLKQYSEVMNQWIEIQKQLESEGKQFYDYDDAGSTSPQYLNSILNN